MTETKAITHGVISVITTNNNRKKYCTCQLKDADIRTGRVDPESVTQRKEDCPFTHG